MNYHRGPPWQRGAGIGSLFSGIFRGLMPVAKSAIKSIGKVAKSEAVKSAGRTLKKQATKAAVETALDALEGRPVGTRAKNRLKDATRSILLNAAKQNNGNTLPSPLISPSKKRKRKPIRSYNTTGKRKRITGRREPMFYEDE